MKYKKISLADANAVKNAVKVLRKLEKKYRKLDDENTKRLEDPNLEWKHWVLGYWRFLDELNSIGIEITKDDEFILDFKSK